jgi:hypothetical protein
MGDSRTKAGPDFGNRFPFRLGQIFALYLPALMPGSFDFWAPIEYRFELLRDSFFFPSICIPEDNVSDF